MLNSVRCDTKGVCISLPALAHQTWLKYKDTSLFPEVSRSFLKSYRKLRTSARKARFFHERVDRAVKSFIASLKTPELIQCQKGCSACCHTQVAATFEESELLVELIKKGHPIDRRRLELQARHAKNWYALSYEDRACIFLKNNECSVYEKPTSCLSS